VHAQVTMQPCAAGAAPEALLARSTVGGPHAAVRAIAARTDEVPTIDDLLAYPTRSLVESAELSADVGL
jgi:hypothetical protein